MVAAVAVVAFAALGTAVPWGVDVAAASPPTPTTSVVEVATTAPETTTPDPVERAGAPELRVVSEEEEPSSTTTVTAPPTTVATTTSSTTTSTTEVPSDRKVTICHATSSETNPFVQLSIPTSQILGANGHDTHEDDIIPPFEGYPGKNWPSPILDAGCVPPATTTSTTTTVPETTTTVEPETTTTTEPETTTTVEPETTTTVPETTTSTTTSTTTTVPVTTSTTLPTTTLPTTTVPTDVLGATTVPGAPVFAVATVTETTTGQGDAGVVPADGVVGTLAFSGSRSEPLVVLGCILLFAGMVVVGSTLQRRSRSD